MKRIIKILLIILLFINKSYSQIIKDASGNDFGSYQISPGGFFYTNQNSKLTFLFKDEDYQAEFQDNEITSCEEGCKSFNWKPEKKISARTIKINIKSRSKDSIIAKNIPIKLEVKNRAPELLVEKEVLHFTKNTGTPLSINLYDYVKDEDNDPLTFTWIKNSINLPKILDGKIEINNDYSTGNKNFILSVSDGYESVMLKFTIEFHYVQHKPEFYPHNFDIIEVTEGDNISIDIHARNSSNDGDLTGISILGMNYGLIYKNGKLEGTILYDAIKNENRETKKQIDITLYAKNNIGESRIGIKFLVNAKASEKEITEIEKLRRTVEYLDSLYWLDYQKIKGLFVKEINRLDNNLARDINNQIEKLPTITNTWYVLAKESINIISGLLANRKETRLNRVTLAFNNFKTDIEPLNKEFEEVLKILEEIEVIGYLYEQSTLNKLKNKVNRLRLSTNRFKNRYDQFKLN